MKIKNPYTKNILNKKTSGVIATSGFAARIIPTAVILIITEFERTCWTVAVRVSPWGFVIPKTGVVENISKTF